MGASWCVGAAGAAESSCSPSLLVNSLAQGCCVVASLIGPKGHAHPMSHIEDNFPGKWMWGTNVFINRMEMSDRKRHLRSYFWICLHFTSWLNISIGIIDWHFYLNKPSSHSWSRHPSSLSFPHSRKSNFTILNLSCHLCFISLKPQPKGISKPHWLCLLPPPCLLPHCPPPRGTVVSTCSNTDAANRRPSCKFASLMFPPH